MKALKDVLKNIYEGSVEVTYEDDSKVTLSALESGNPKDLKVMVTPKLLDPYKGKKIEIIGEAWIEDGDYKNTQIIVTHGTNIIARHLKNISITMSEDSLKKYKYKGYDSNSTSCTVREQGEWKNVNVEYQTVNFIMCTTPPLKNSHIECRQVLYHLSKDAYSDVKENPTEYLGISKDVDVKELIRVYCGPIAMGDLNMHTNRLV